MAPGKPANHELHLWVVRATQSHPRKELLLSSHEHARAKKFHHSDAGERWAYFHCALREILSQYTDPDPAKLQFESVKNNKPVLKNRSSSVNFNLSHSHDMALVAVASQVEIGIDIERVRALTNMEALAERHFSPEENDRLLQVSEPQRRELFFETWTRKEAVIKANGRGLRIPLSQFSTPNAGVGQWQETSISQDDHTKYLLCGLDVAPDFCASMCIERPMEQKVQDPNMKVHQYDCSTF